MREAYEEKAVVESRRRVDNIIKAEREYIRGRISLEDLEAKKNRIQKMFSYKYRIIGSYK